MESVLPVIGVTPTVGGYIKGVEYALKLGKMSYSAVKTITGGRTGVRELSEGIVRKGLTGSGVAPLTGSNKTVVGSAKKLSENKSMAPTTPPRTPKAKKRKSSKEKKSKSSKKARTDKKQSKVSKAAGESVGKYAGKLKRSKKAPKPMNVTTASEKGYVVTKDITGVVSDSQCVYIYHSTYEASLIARAMTAAVLRLLFLKAGIEITNEQTELPLYEAAHSVGFKIVYYDKDPITQDGSSVPAHRYEYYIEDNTTFVKMLDDICTWGTNSLYQRFVNHMVIPTFNNVPVSITLCVKDVEPNPNPPATVPVNSWRTHTHVGLTNLHLALMCKSEIMLQNRTRGSNAGATDYSDQRVDNQPLKGKLYEFRNGDPRLRQSQKVGDGILDQNDFLYNTGCTKAIRSFGQDIFPNDTMDSPPIGKLWKNVEKTSNVLIEPGDIKKAQVDVKYDLALPELLSKFRVVAEGQHKASFSYVGLKSHKSQIVALEEVLKTPNDNFITCNYQVRLTYAAYAYLKRDKVILRSFHVTENINQFVNPT